MQQFASCDMKNSLGKKFFLGLNFAAVIYCTKSNLSDFTWTITRKKIVAKKKQSHQSSPCHPKWTVAVTCYLS